MLILLYILYKWVTIDYLITNLKAQNYQQIKNVLWSDRPDDTDNDWKYKILLRN